MRQISMNGSGLYRLHVDLLWHSFLEVNVILIHPEAVPDAYHMVLAAFNFKAESAILSRAHQCAIDIDLEGGWTRIDD